MLGQFKTHAWTTTEKILLNGMSRMDSAAMSGTLSLLAMGAMTQVVKDALNNRRPVDGDAFVRNAVDRSGITGILAEAYGFGSKLFPSAELDRYKSRNLGSAALGPSVGTIFDASQLLTAISNKLAGQEFTDTDMRKARKLMPYNTLFYLRNLFQNYENTLRDKPAPTFAPLELSRSHEPRQRDINDTP